MPQIAKKLRAVVFGFLASLSACLETLCATRVSDATQARDWIDAALDCVIIIDEHGRILQFNAAAEELFGYSRAAVIGRKLVETIIPPELRAAHELGLSRYLKTGENRVIGTRVEVPGLRADGTRVLVELSVARVARARRPEFKAHLRDITDRKRTEQELLDREARLRSIVETAVDGIVVIDKRGIVESFNPAAERIFGFRADEVLGRNISMLMPSPYREEHDEYLNQYLQTGVAKVIGIGRQVKGRRKDGSVFPLDLSVSRMELGGTQYFTGIVRDVTEHVNLIARLAQNAQVAQVENRVRAALLQSAPAQCHEEVLNVLLQAFESTIGVLGVMDEHSNMSCDILLPQEAAQGAQSTRFLKLPRASWSCNWLQALNGRRSLTCNAPHAFADGHPSMSRSICSPLLCGGRELGILQVAGRDRDYDERDQELLDTVCAAIAPVLAAQVERNKLECQRRETERELIEGAKLANLTADVVMSLSRGAGQLDNVLHCADSIRRNLEAVDVNIWTLVPEQGLELRATLGPHAHIESSRLRQPLDDATIGRIVRDRRPLLINDALAARAAYCGDSAVADSVGAFAGLPLQVNDRLIGILGVYHFTAINDSTWKALTAVADSIAIGLDRLQQESSLREAKCAAEAASRAKSEFLANMSHEIRTPMTAILGFADVLLQDDDLRHAPPLRVEAVRTIHENGYHLLAILNDVLDLSKIEAGKLAIACERLSPRRVVNDVMSLVSARAKTKGLDLVARFLGDIPEIILSDSLRLRQILMNLLGNAIKFTEEGTVELVLRCDRCSDDYVNLHFAVSDTGIGISPEHCKGLFEAFNQADSTVTRRHGGTGLGLAISNRLAGMLGGSISLDSSLGKGSTFTLTISVKSVAGQSEDSYTLKGDARRLSSDVSRPLKVPSAERLRNVNVLLVEDGIDNQRLLSLFLRKAGACVTVAENGRKALQLLTEDSTITGALLVPSPFDVILMDMQMPEMDGYTAANVLRDKGNQVPVIALTAHAMIHEREKCLASGCDDFAAKPVDRQALIALVEHWRPIKRADRVPIPYTAKMT